MRKRRVVAVRMARWVGSRVLATLGVLAMLTPALTPLATSDLAAYRPDHGHLHAGSMLPDHDHPWDERREASSPLGMTVFDALAVHPATEIAPVPVAPEAQQEHLEVVFTHGDDGSPGSSSGLALPGGAPPLGVSASMFRELVSVAPTSRTRPLSVPTEPPRA